MFASSAMAQTAGPAAPGGPAGGPMDMIIQFAPFILLFVLFYVLMIRPQQKRAKAQAAMIAAVKRGDTVVMASGMKGKVTGVADTEVTVEIAPNVNVKVVKSMLADVVTRGEPAPANDGKSKP